MAERKSTLYLSSQTSSKRNPLKTLFTTIASPSTRGRQQVATRVIEDDRARGVARVRYTGPIRINLPRARIASRSSRARVG
jgi:hypothetical protein